MLRGSVKTKWYYYEGMKLVKREKRKQILKCKALKQPHFVLIYTA